MIDKQGKKAVRNQYVVFIALMTSLLLSGCDVAKIMSQPIGETISEKFKKSSAFDVADEYAYNGASGTTCTNQQDIDTNESNRINLDDYDLSEYYKYNGAVDDIADRIDHERYLKTSTLDQIYLPDDDTKKYLLYSIWGGKLYNYNMDAAESSYEIYSTCELPKSIIRELSVNSKKIPSEILDAFFVRKDGLLIITEDIKFFSPDSPDGAIGVSNCPKSIIYIRFDEPQYPYYDTFFHEMGHHIAYMTGSPDISDEWTEIWENSPIANNHEVNHEYGDQTEFFAEMCYWYFDDPEELKKDDPDAYDYINDIITNFSEYSGIESAA